VAYFASPREARPGPCGFILPRIGGIIGAMDLFLRKEKHPQASDNYRRLRSDYFRLRRPVSPGGRSKACIPERGIERQCGPAERTQRPNSAWPARKANTR
jgi:hypothetical protein